MTTALDTHNQIEYAKEIAHEEGLEEGLAKEQFKRSGQDWSDLIVYCRPRPLGLKATAV